MICFRFPVAKVGSQLITVVSHKTCLKSTYSISFLVLMSPNEFLWKCHHPLDNFFPITVTIKQNKKSIWNSNAGLYLSFKKGENK